MRYKDSFRSSEIWKVFIFCAFILLVGAARAQNPILLECMNINKAYLNNSYLSFNVKYKYSFESAPSTILDSSQGVFKMNGYKYWGKIDSVEMLQSDSFNVTVFKQDSVVSLGVTHSNFIPALPLAQWDSMFFQNDRFTFSTSVDSIWKKITVNYSANLPYKKCELWYDSVTYRINRIKYTVSQYAGEEAFYSLPDGGSYAIVDMLFTNYQTGTFGDSVFSPWVYVTYAGGTYSLSSAYSGGYQLYSTSPGIIINTDR